MLSSSSESLFLFIFSLFTPKDLRFLCLSQSPKDATYAHDPRTMTF